MDRDANAAIIILSNWFEQLAVFHSEETPVETALPMFTSSESSNPIDVKDIVETGRSTCEEERCKSRVGRVG
jgi:putative transposase